MSHIQKGGTKHPKYIYDGTFIRLDFVCFVHSVRSIKIKSKHTNREYRSMNVIQRGTESNGLRNEEHKYECSTVYFPYH